MKCPHCQHPDSTSTGKTAAGSARRRCKSCGRKYTPAPLAPGPKATYASNAERQSAYRERLKRDRIPSK